MKHYSLKDITTQGLALKLQEITIKGWVRSFRSNRFIAINDGSSLQNFQIVVDFETFDAALLNQITVGSSIEVYGEIVKSQGSGQEIEMQAKNIQVLGAANTDLVQETILQPKRHSMERLREQAHLRFRTNTFSTIMRVRNTIMFAIHEYFNQNGFIYINTPIITGSDAEGAGEMFTVTNFDLEKIQKNKDGKIDFEADFFAKKTHLTVSGQLEAEAAAMGLGKVYTFGPTFRAENSNTSRHLAEFWMIEPEMAFYDLDDNMDLAEDFLKFIIQKVLDKNPDDLKFLNDRYVKEEQQKPTNERSGRSLFERLNSILENQFIRLSYTEAIEILKNSKPNKKGKFQFPIQEFGDDLQSEHERYLVEKYFKAPVILFDYPAKIKAFYMRANDDGKTVRAMDVLFPGIGEMIGGSQREERYEVLKQKMEELDIDQEELSWYLDLRKIGTVPHSGFGLGLGRLVQFVTGMGNIRDVYPFPRFPKSADF